MPKYLVVHAHDLGVPTGINRGTLECHTRRVVTSISLRVTRSAVAEAVSRSRDAPALTVGLHWDVIRLVSLADIRPAPAGEGGQRG